MDVGKERFESGTIRLSHNRLFVGLVWDTLDLPSNMLLGVDSILTRILSEKCSTPWDAELYRIYVGDQNEELVRRLECYRAQGRIRRWRRPRHNGRRTPPEWSPTIRKHISDWCLYEPAAKEGRTTAVLVTNHGRFDSTLRELIAAGVQILIVSTRQVDRYFSMGAARSGIELLHLEDWDVDGN